jgi:hypothetical protein
LRDAVLVPRLMGDQRGAPGSGSPPFTSACLPVGVPKTLCS